MNIQRREEFISYCLRRLGDPVIEINVDAEQVEDRVDDALSYFIGYHYDGSERELTVVEIDVNMAASQSIKLDKDIIAVLRAVPSPTAFDAALTGAPSAQQSNGMISLNYISNMGASTSAATVNAKSYVSMSVMNEVNNWLFRPEKVLTFRHANNTLTFDVNTTPLIAGQKYCLEVYRAVNPETSETIWNDIWLKAYATALIKQQWGQNLSKYSGVQLPTGITLDGQKILDDANVEVKDLEARLRDEFQLPADFFLG